VEIFNFSSFYTQVSSLYLGAYYTGKKVARWKKKPPKKQVLRQNLAYTDPKVFNFDKICRKRNVPGENSRQIRLEAKK
jgi:hypothetical protein